MVTRYGKTRDSKLQTELAEAMTESPAPYWNYEFMSEELDPTRWFSLWRRPRDPPDQPSELVMAPHIVAVSIKQLTIKKPWMNQ